MFKVFKVPKLAETFSKTEKSHTDPTFKGASRPSFDCLHVAENGAPVYTTARFAPKPFCRLHGSVVSVEPALPSTRQHGFLQSSHQLFSESTILILQVTKNAKLA